MREAVGGSLLFYIIIIFLIIYIFFVGFVMNYASAYRASNYVISRLEEYEGGININDDDFVETVKERYKYQNGFTLCCSDNTNGSVYKLTAKVQFELPLINIDLPINLKTETKTIYNVPCSQNNQISVCKEG